MNIHVKKQHTTIYRDIRNMCAELIQLQNVSLKCAFFVCVSLYLSRSVDGRDQLCKERRTLSMSGKLQSMTTLKRTRKECVNDIDRTVEQIMQYDGKVLINITL